MAQAPHSLRDIIRMLERQDVARYGPSERLRSTCWLAFAIHHRGTAREFAKTVYGQNKDSKLVTKWLSGKTQPTRSSVKRIESAIPGSLALYDLPLWSLLRDEPLGPKEVEELMAPFRATAARGMYWRFPNDSDLASVGRYGGCMVRADTQGLFQRGDIYGFIAIVAAVRTSEAQDLATHAEACADMYRALPSIYRLPWFKQQRSLLEQCLQAIRSRVLSTLMAFDIDWEVINRQADDPAFEPRRELRNRDSTTGRFESLEDPILYGEWIPGAEVKRRKQIKLAAATRRAMARIAGVSRRSSPEGT